MMQRKPSHFGSNSRPSSYVAGSGMPLADFASMGDSGGFTGRSIGSQPTLAGRGSETPMGSAHDGVAGEQVAAVAEQVPQLQLDGRVQVRPGRQDAQWVAADQLGADREAQLVEPSGHDQAVVH